MPFKRKTSSVVKAVKKVLPAVVNVAVSGFMQLPPMAFNNSQGRFFAFPKRKKIKMGGGSGFIVDKNGIILTNRHVVENPHADYMVILQNGEQLKPQIIARDPIHDIAVLKIEKTDLATIELGNSTELELGEEVIAIGNVLGLFQNTISTGVVSGLSREIKAQSEFSPERTKLRGLIQTDAAINPGNSGGPLINLDGKAVGINAAMVFGAENIGFALPINNAKKALAELKEFGRIRQPYLGFRYLIIDPEIQGQFSLPVACGALIIAEPHLRTGILEAIVPGSPAAKAGLQEADIILELANQRITEEKFIADILQEFKIGQTLPIKILRGSKEKFLKITLGERI